MKVIKDFLETSSIHGFFFVGDSKHPLIRFFWIATVIAGFVGSYIMISISVRSWSDNQVSTTVQTLPISGVTIPRVTVCPPKVNIEAKYEVKIKQQPRAPSLTSTTTW